MIAIIAPTLLFLILLLSAGIGWIVQPRLREHHLSREAIETNRLLIAMLVTFSALVLGLLTSSAKQRFDDYSAALDVYSADLIELDHRLRVYGSDASRIRGMLRAYTAAAIADTWPSERKPAGEYPRFDHSSGESGVEERPLGKMLAEIDVAMEQLTPSDEFHRQIAARLRDRVANTIQQRWRLILSAGSTISWPFLLVLTAWLAIIFAIFGLTAPRSGLVYIVVGLSALSIASPLYLILDYSGRQTGLLELPSISMRAALSHMDDPD